MKEEVQKEQYSGKVFTDEQKTTLNSIIDDIQYQTKIKDIESLFELFESKYEEFGGDLKQLKYDQEIFLGKYPSVKALRKLGRMALKTKKTFEELKEDIKRYKK